MAIILVGGGAVAERLIGTLESNGHDVTLITPDARDAEEFAFAFPGAMVISGDARDPVVLKQAGAGDAAHVVAATDDDAYNLSVCLLAREAFHVPVVTGLAGHPQNVRIFHALGIPCISCSEIIAEGVLGALEPHAAAVSR